MDCDTKLLDRAGKSLGPKQLPLEPKQIPTTARQKPPALVGAGSAGVPPAVSAKREKSIETGGLVNRLDLAFRTDAERRVRRAVASLYTKGAIVSSGSVTPKLKLAYGKQFSSASNTKN